MEDEPSQTTAEEVWWKSAGDGSAGASPCRAHGVLSGPKRLVLQDSRMEARFGIQRLMPDLQEGFSQLEPSHIGGQQIRGPYSAVSATSGSSEAARRAGSKPLASPTTRLTAKAKNTNSTGVLTGSAGT